MQGKSAKTFVVAKFGRRGIIAIIFAGNVPVIDVVGYKDGSIIHLQVKA